MEPFLGQIILFGGNFAPRGWALCDGQLLPISANTALFSILGTTYGGDGRTTFALPDLRGRAPIHPGHGPGLSDRRLGDKGGEEHVTLNSTQMPNHSHPNTLKVSNSNATVSAATNGVSIATPGSPDGRGFNATFGFSSDTPNIDLNSESIASGGVGGSQSHNNMPPWLGLNYIIALQGIFPSRS